MAVQILRDLHKWEVICSKPLRGPLAKCWSLIQPWCHILSCLLSCVQEPSRKIICYWIACSTHCPSAMRESSGCLWEVALACFAHSTNLAKALFCWVANTSGLHGPLCFWQARVPKRVSHSCCFCCRHRQRHCRAGWSALAVDISALRWCMAPLVLLHWQAIARSLPASCRSFHLLPWSVLVCCDFLRWWPFNSSWRQDCGLNASRTPAADRHGDFKWHAQYLDSVSSCGNNTLDEDVIIEPTGSAAKRKVWVKDDYITCLGLPALLKPFYACQKLNDLYSWDRTFTTFKDGLKKRDICQAYIWWVFY